MKYLNYALPFLLIATLSSADEVSSITQVLEAVAPSKEQCDLDRVRLRKELDEEIAFLKKSADDLLSLGGKELHDKLESNKAEQKAASKAFAFEKAKKLREDGVAEIVREFKKGPKVVKKLQELSAQGIEVEFVNDEFTPEVRKQGLYSMTQLVLNRANPNNISVVDLSYGFQEPTYGIYFTQKDPQQRFNRNMDARNPAATELLLNPLCNGTSHFKKIDDLISAEYRLDLQPLQSSINLDKSSEEAPASKSTLPDSSFRDSFLVQ